MSMCIITVWTTQLDVRLEAAAAEFLKDGVLLVGFCDASPMLTQNQRVLQGGSHLWMACDPIHPQSRAALELGEVMQGLIVKVSVYTRNGKFTASLGPCYCLTAPIVKNIFLKPNCNCSLYLLTALFIVYLWQELAPMSLLLLLTQQKTEQICA